MDPERQNRLNGWISTFRGPLTGLLVSWGASWRDAAELAQDVFAESFTAFARFRGDPDDEGAVGAWLRGIAFRLFSEWQRRRRRAGRPLEESPEPAVDESSEVSEDRRRVVRAAIERLPRKFRTVIWMRYLDASPVRRVAALLGETEKTIERRLAKARQELKRILVERELTADGRPQE